MNTKIEWTDATWNPVTGCIKVSAGCKNCYAERLAPRVFAGQTVVDHYAELSPSDALGPRPRRFTDVLCHPERLDAPLHWRKPRRIFVNSMSDLFHEDVSFNFIDRVFAAMALSPQHTFQILTKRPERLLAWATDEQLGRWGYVDGCARQIWREYSGKEFPVGKMLPFKPLPHVWLGVSVENQPTAEERIPLLLQTPAAVRFISAEPVIAPIQFRDEWLRCPGGAEYGHGLSRTTVHAGCCQKHSCLNWVIAGGESGPNARPSHPDWFRSLRDQCAAVGVPYFFKQWGEWAPWKPIDGNPTKRPIQHVMHNGSAYYPGNYASSLQSMIRLGKKTAGRLLDNRTHDEYPA